MTPLPFILVFAVFGPLTHGQITLTEVREPTIAQCTIEGASYAQRGIDLAEKRHQTPPLITWNCISSAYDPVDVTSQCEGLTDDQMDRLSRAEAAGVPPAWDDMVAVDALQRCTK
jgi:hypothetical protein